MPWRLEATEVSLLTRAKEAHRRSLPPRQLPWAAPAAPHEPEAAATAKEVLQSLGNPPPLPPKPPAAGYPGFQGPFEGDAFSRRSGSARSSRSDLRAGSMDRITQPGSASRALSASGGVSAGGRASSLRSRQQTPAAAACRRLASKGRL
ncbi:unnamed protein product [Effrenium voratum]|uniref:Uncharacterized protein n=1 Tax=Effrenium voratum TaxID=2562239 RepID=A0AA36NJK1_9DINO|nr:unnamed protein product [Effrenium voratum]